MHLWVKRLLTGLVALPGFSGTLPAVIWHNDFSYGGESGAAGSQALASDFTNFPFLESAAIIHATNSMGTQRATGVLIGSQWVLTTGHSLPFDMVSGSISIGGGTHGFDGSQVIYHPNWLTPPAPLSQGQVSFSQGWDLALIQLSAPVLGVQPAQLYTGNMELGQAALFAGAGFVGTGTTSFAEQSGTPVVHAAMNVIDRVISQHEQGWPGGTFAVDFDSGGTTHNTLGNSGYFTLNPSGIVSEDPNDPSSPNPLLAGVDIVEGALAPGDSGGPAFIQDEHGNWRLAGVGLGGANPLYPPEDFSGLYGSVGVFIRISQFISWLQSQTHVIPEPGGGKLILVALLLWLARAKGLSGRRAKKPL